MVEALQAAKNYFEGTKQDIYGDTFSTRFQQCQPRVLLMTGPGISGGEAPYAEDTAENVASAVEDLADINVSTAVLYYATGKPEVDEFPVLMAEKGHEYAVGKDNVYALNDTEGAGVLPHYFTKWSGLLDKIIDLTGILDTPDGDFYGTAPVPWESMMLGTSFNAVTKSGEISAYEFGCTPQPCTPTLKWKASEQVPPWASRKNNMYVYENNGGSNVALVKPLSESGNIPDVILDCWEAKPIGEIIHATPIIVAGPPFFYTFDNYLDDFKSDTEVSGRVPTIYATSNDGALHAFYLEDDDASTPPRLAGQESWLFIPGFVKDDMVANPSDYDRYTNDEYCFRYKLDGSPVVADIFADTDNNTTPDKWKTILVCGQGKGDSNYFAMDITYGGKPDPNSVEADASKFLWTFNDSDLGRSQSTPAIARIADGGDRPWAVFFSSSFAVDEADQEAKEAYLFGIRADNGGKLWQDSVPADIHKIKVKVSAELDLEYVETVAFAVGETVTNGSDFAGTIKSITPGGGGLNPVMTLVDVENTVAIADPLSGSTAGTGVAASKLLGLRNNILSSPMGAALDYSDPHRTNHIYTGSSYGTMFRVSDIDYKQTPVVSKLFDFAPPLEEPDLQPITAKSNYAYGVIGSDKIWVYFGTGELMYDYHQYTIDQQYMFGLKDKKDIEVNYIDPTWQHNYTYDTASDKLKGADETVNTLTHTAGYYEFDVDGEDGIEDDEKFRTIVKDGTYDSAIDYSAWAIKLGMIDDFPADTASGSERLVEQQLVAGGVVFFLTYVPNSNVCNKSGGKSWLFAVNYKTGLLPTEPVFKLSTDDFTDTVGPDDTEVSGILVGDGKASRPVLHSHSGKTSILVTTFSGSIEEIEVNLPSNSIDLDTWREE